MTTLSIITPSLNSVAVLADCIESVRGQRVNCEHILVDGASTDGTLKLAESYLGHFAQIVSERDAGLYAAMNKGLGLAKGKIVGILNSDDFYVSDEVLASIIEVFNDSGVDACYGDLEYVSAEDPTRVVRRWQADTFCRAKFYNGWMPPHPTLFVRKSLYEKYGLFREDLGTSADYEFMLRLFVKHNLQAHYIPRVLVRMRAGGVSNRTIATRWRANRNDARAWTVNALTPKPWTLLLKPLRKISQWWVW